ncbi:MULTISPECIES: VMAP-C domain-containing protein [Streptomycetaceae]|uniref:VMAP-C domain-containing protein n=1 Tax=Streptomycetaceae TaxID=2062 RepID=UPI000213EEA3|nr:caspase family protein [Streptantibioticus cattleyicolor]MYS58610.1 caspase family protein [Streptomyces sp. SID5468]CCB74280.1 protein of unknown function [Streptantibioticus cattleyicolor NRRL 8057 = DSM 46488]
MSAGWDTERVHVVAVAVEEYAGGAAWHLDGPVRDALGLIDWLTGLGVPERNVHLLAAPLPANAALLAGRGHAGADRGTVRTFFKRVLPRLDGDWLWVYWAGHGVQVKGSEWSLLYPEAREDDLVGLDAGKLVDYLCSDALAPHRFGRVVTVVDACRQPLPPAERAAAPEPDHFITRETLHRGRQAFVWRACEPGGLAKNTGGEGLFTRTLLTGLRAAPDGAGPPDLDAAARRVDDAFDRLRETGQADQLPNLYRRDWRGNETDRPAPPPLTGEQLRAKAQLTRVTELLTADPHSAAAFAFHLVRELSPHAPVPRPAATAGELVDVAIGTAHGVTTLLAALDATRPAEPGPHLDHWRHTVADAEPAARPLRPSGEWLTGLEHGGLLALLATGRTLPTLVGAAHDELPGVRLTAPDDPPAVLDDLERLVPRRHQLPQLLRITERTAALLPPDDAAALQSWSDRCAERIGMTQALLARRADLQEETERTGHAADGDRVQIRLSGPAGGGRTYEIWYRRGTEVVAVAKGDRPRPAAGISDDLDEALYRYARAHETLVEFFLPAADLDLEVHRWTIRARTDVERRLGTDYPVVVRGTDPRPQPYVHTWRKRWERVAAGTVRDLHWLPDDLERDRVPGALSLHPDAPGCVVTAPARHRTGIFLACVVSGVPVLVWHRAEERRAARDRLEPLLGAVPLARLPHHLRELRAAGDLDDDHHGKHLALLWDDPGHPLPRRLDLSAPV